MKTARSPVPFQRPFLLTSNFYRISNLPSDSVMIYSVSFTPEIPPDHSGFKKQVISSYANELKARLGDHIFCGDTLFVLSAYPIHEIFQFTQEASKHSVSFSYVKSLNLNKRFDFLPDELAFVNILIKEFLKKCNLHQLDRNHFDLSRKFPLSCAKVAMYPGYFTSIVDTIGGLTLNIDTCCKLIREDTVLDLIHRYLQLYPTNYQAKLASDLEGKVVITTYGRLSTYRIVKILFGLSPQDKFCLENEQAVTYAEYYLEKYQAKVTILDQPMLRVQVSKQRPDIMLVPELCRMTGTSNLDDPLAIKKEISRTSRMNPGAKLKEVQVLAEAITRHANSEWGIEINATPIAVEPTPLKPPIVQFGNKEIRVGLGGTFNLKDVSLAATVDLHTWQIFYTSRDAENVRRFCFTLQKLGRTMGCMVHHPTLHLLSLQGPSEQILKQFSGLLDLHSQLAVIVLPRNRQDLYKGLKRTLTAVCPRPSQVILGSTLVRDNLSVASKILVQISAKLGSVPWVVKTSSEIPAHTMIVGIDVCHNTFRRKQSVLGFSASLNRDYSKYYNQTAFHSPGQEISHCLTPLFTEAFTHYQHLNNAFPSTIIIYRDGVGDSQYQTVISQEVPQLLAAIRQYDCTRNPEIIVMVVNKRVHARFFAQSNNRIENPPHGLVVDTEVVLPHSNFYMVSHLVNSGTLTPTHYNIIVNTSAIPLLALQQFTYELCYMYFNWSGGIRVPAPCMHAHKLAYLVGTYTGTQPSENLAPTMFYL